MDRRGFLRGTALAGTVAVAGCGGEGDADDGGSDGSDDPGGTVTGTTLPESEVVTPSGPPCEAVAGTTFRSVEKRDGGRGPDGGARVHWEVRFEEGAYRYFYSDVVESGTYTCGVEDGTATLEGSTADPELTYSGTYDPATGVLQWDEVRYRPVETD